MSTMRMVWIVAVMVLLSGCDNSSKSTIGVGEPFPIPPSDPKAFRAFLGPHTFPPKDYAAYGILAFPIAATSISRPRHIMICEAYVATLPSSISSSVPPKEQMVTVWPLESAQLADKLNAYRRRKDICGEAVDNYHIDTAIRSLKDARATGADVSGNGPYLLAWSPSAEKGKPDALVLQVDLSDVTTDQQATDILRGWRSDIEQDPSLWVNGWNINTVKLKIRLWADKYGTDILKIFGA